MLVSDLISKLQSLKKEFGNVEVHVSPDTFSDVSDDYTAVSDAYFNSSEEHILLYNDFDAHSDF